MSRPEHATVAEEGTEAETLPSKSEAKRQSAALRDLGTELLLLRREQLEKMALPADLLEALLLAQSMKRDGAFKRQTKFIGKLLRHADHATIAAKLDATTAPSAAAARHLHCIEHWRDRILTESASAIGEFAHDFPQAESTKLRRLADLARLEHERGQPPKSARLLFKYLREIMDGAIASEDS